MFYWTAWDGTLTPRTLQTPTFRRDSIATFIDSEGRLARVAADQPRWYRHAETDLFGLLLEGLTSTNLCLRSEDFANWTAVNSPSQTANALRIGLLNLALLIDDSAVNQEYYQRTDVNMTGAACVVSVFVAQGTSPAASGTQILLIDSGAVTRLDVTVTWTAGVPTVTPATGTFLGKVACADGVYRLLLKTSANPAAGNATLRIIMAKTASQTGNIYAGGFQVENNLNVPSQYIATTTATVNRPGEVLYWPLLAYLRDLTLYTRFTDLGSGLQGGAAVTVGDQATPPWMLVNSGVGSTSAMVNAGGGTNTATVVAGSAFGLVGEMRNSVTKAGLITAGFAASGGSEATATLQGTALPDSTPWGVQRLQPAFGTGGGPILLNQIAVYPTVLTMDQLRKRG